MHEAILDKVRKILAKAEDPAATREEAETYTAKAAELVAAYGIDRALLAQDDPASDVVGDRVVVLDPPYALDKADLLGSVASQLRCRAVQRTTFVDGAKVLSLHLFGYESDLQRSEVLYTSLLLQATSLVTRTPVPYAENVAAFRRSWLAGFTAAIAARLAEAEERASRAAEGRAPGGRPDDDGSRGGSRPSVALVLADRSAAVTLAVEERYPRLRKSSGRRLSGSGAHSGWSAGQRADLGGGTGLDRRGRRRITPAHF